MMMPSRISRSVMMAGTLAETAAQWTQHLGYQLTARIFAPGVVDQLAQGLDFSSFSRCSMVSCSVSQLLVRRAPGATAGVSRLTGTPFHPVEDLQRLLDVVIAVQTVSTIGTQRLKQAVAALPGAKRGRIYPA